MEDKSAMLRSKKLTCSLRHHEHDATYHYPGNGAPTQAHIAGLLVRWPAGYVQWFTRFLLGTH